MTASILPADGERLLPLAGGHNFRDLGGYDSADGRRVRRGVLFRSGKLSALTPDDAALLAGKGIRVVCDLRTPGERTREPLAANFGARLRGWDRDLGGARLHAVAGAPGATPAHVHDALRAAYEAMPWSYAEPYGDVLRHLADGDVPLVFHCAAGKDRTGALAALILAALGVPDETVLADYLLTDRFLDLEALVAGEGRTDGEAEAASGYGFLRALSPELRAPLLACHPAFVEAMLRAVRTRHGSVAGYLDQALGVGAADLRRIGDVLLEAAG